MGKKAEATTAPKTNQAPKKVEHKNIYAAISALQGELKTLPKSKTVSFERKDGKGTVEYKYTPLGDIMEAIYPKLGKHGLSVRHEIVKEGTKDAIIAILKHESYEVEAHTMTDTKREEMDGPNVDTSTERIQLEEKNVLRSGPVVISQGGEMKDTGAAITYARRYTLTMLLGIATEEDLDTQLLTEGAKNAISFAYKRVKKTLDEVGTKKDAEKHTKNLEKDLELVKSGKASSLGLNQSQIEELISHGKYRQKQIEQGIDPADSPEEEENGTVDATK